MAPTLSAPQPQQAPLPEQTLWHGTPSWSLLIGKMLRAALVIVVLVAILYFAFDLLAQYGKIGTLVVVAVAIWQVGAIVLAYARIRTTIYTVTNQRVIIETGLASKSVEDIDLRTIDDTQFQQSLFERMLGIGKVLIISSDKMAPQYVLRGIPDPRNMRELIRAQVYNVSQRQLFTRAT